MIPQITRMRLNLRPRKYPRIERSSARQPTRRDTLVPMPIVGEKHQKIRLSMQDLPLEVIHRIATYFDISSSELGSLMRTCRHVSFATEYRRYTSIVVVGEAGTRLMATLISGTLTSKRYCRRVKCLWFRGWNDTCMYLNSTLLSQLLTRLDNLITLWVESNPLDAVQFLTRMKVTGVTRESVHPASVLPDIVRRVNAYSKLALPNLRYMKLTGDPSIADLLRFRPLKELDMNFYLQPHQFAKFIEASEGSILAKTLETLSIKFGRPVEIDLAFPLLCQALPSLNCLSMEQTSLNFETVLEHLALNRQLLPHLRVLAVNRRFSHPIVVLGTALPKLFPISDVMEEYMQLIAPARPGFEMVGLGKIVWRVGLHGKFYKRTVPSHPDFWSTDFGESFRHSRFDPDFLPNYVIEIFDNT